MPQDDEYNRMIHQLVVTAYVFAIMCVVIGVVFFVTGLYGIEIIHD